MAKLREDLCRQCNKRDGLAEFKVARKSRLGWIPRCFTFCSELCKEKFLLESTCVICGYTEDLVQKDGRRYCDERMPFGYRQTELTCWEEHNGFTGICKLCTKKVKKLRYLQDTIVCRLCFQIVKEAFLGDHDEVLLSLEKTKGCKLQAVVK